MDTLTSQNAFADTSRDEDEVGSPLVMRSPSSSEVETDPTEGDEKEAFLKLAHAM
ncbi:hypothetical protein [Aureimonas sp. AU20]|uniref:hypothetical protein n=1 Tax=Aureimonas sp. AU20 TaxID=1349819 RepID=UPI00072056E9|nr:hypothetical protein [Aureimonas sp. AU20]ALN72451.1 hypothetical protein M673_06980 [Aureimonas sp. AU20]